MAEFSKIISTLLNDVVQAQHEANLYAGRLQDEYREGGKANGFTLPYATIGDIELNLNYGITEGMSEREQIETDYRKLYAFLKDFSYQVAKVTISGVMSSVKATDIAVNVEAQRVWILLSGESAEYRKLLIFLSRRIYSRLVGDIGIFLDGEGSLLAEPLVTLFCAIARNDLLCLPEVECLFAENKKGKLREEVENTLGDTLRPFITQQISGYNFANKQMVPTVEVIVDAEGLEKLPTECIHSIRLKLNLRDSPMYVEPDNKE